MVELIKFEFSQKVNFEPNSMADSPFNILVAFYQSIVSTHEPGKRIIPATRLEIHRPQITAKPR